MFSAFYSVFLQHLFYSLVKMYKEKARRITCTGGGVQPVEDTGVDSRDLNEYLVCYIGLDSPDDYTVDAYKNIWGA